VSLPLEGRVAIVTGAFGRLGPLWCEALVDAGATVVGLDLPGARAPERFAALERRAGEKLRALPADVRDRASLVAARDRCASEAGTASILVNNAGIDQPPGPVTTYRIEDIPVDVFRGTVDVNLVGAFQAAQVFGPGMVEAGHGSIINIGSLYASVSPDPRLYDHIETDPPFIKPPAYGASKAAVVNLTRYLATAWGPHGVRVNTLSPGGVLGAQDEHFKRKFCSRVPLGRMAVYQDLIGPLQFLASDASAYVTGTELRIDGGFTAW
jgi:NAD(P)-dependent dehydrogenase (short-subunit alcohol dehydrogenase family)